VPPELERFADEVRLTMLPGLDQLWVIPGVAGTSFSPVPGRR
jgi:hypothetical protein